MNITGRWSNHGRKSSWNPRSSPRVWKKIAAEGTWTSELSHFCSEWKWAMGVLKYVPGKRPNPQIRPALGLRSYWATVQVALEKTLSNPTSRFLNCWASQLSWSKHNVLAGKPKRYDLKPQSWVLAKQTNRTSLASQHRPALVLVVCWCLAKFDF